MDCFSVRFVTVVPLILTNLIIGTATSDVLVQSGIACFGNASNFGESSSTVGSSRQLLINCGQDYMVRIRNTTYGYSSNGLGCVPHPNDCIETANLHYSCIGRSQCSLNMPSGRLGKYLRKCQQHSTYFLVNYQCVPRTEVLNICDHKTIVSQRGYLRTPNYPLDFVGRYNCSVLLEVEPWQQISLSIVDLQLRPSERSDNGCVESWFYVFDPKYGQYTTCHRRSNADDIFTSQQNILQVTFESTAAARAKGIWLYFQARPERGSITFSPASLQTAASFVRKTTPAPVSADVIAMARVTASNFNNQSRLWAHGGFLQACCYKTSWKNKPVDCCVVGFAVGVLGVLLLVLIALLTMLIRRRKSGQDGSRRGLNVSQDGDSSCVSMTELSRQPHGELPLSDGYQNQALNAEFDHSSMLSASDSGTASGTANDRLTHQPGTSGVPPFNRRRGSVDLAKYEAQLASCRASLQRPYVGASIVRTPVPGGLSLAAPSVAGPSSAQQPSTSMGRPFEQITTETSAISPRMLSPPGPPPPALPAPDVLLQQHQRPVSALALHLHSEGGMPPNWPIKKRSSLHLPPITERDHFDLLRPRTVTTAALRSSAGAPLFSKSNAVAKARVIYF